MTVRVFLLDDHEVVRRGLRDLLEAEDDFEVVGEAGTAEEAYGRIPATTPDVADESADGYAVRNRSTYAGKRASRSAADDAGPCISSTFCSTSAIWSSR